MNHPARSICSRSLIPDPRHQHSIDNLGRSSREPVCEDSADRTLDAEPGVVPPGEPQIAFDDGVWPLYFCNVLLARVDERDYVIRA